MRVSYQVDEFLGMGGGLSTMSVLVDKKVSLLYDFCLLRTKKGRPDEREDAVRKWLSTYCTETQLDRALHSILTGDASLNTTLTKKGLM